MTPGPVSLAATDTVAEATQFLTEKAFGAAVVIDEAGHPLGVVTKTDILVHARQRKPGLEPDDTPVTEFMTPAVFSVRPDTPAARWWNSSSRSTSITSSCRTPRGSSSASSAPSMSYAKLG